MDKKYSVLIVDDDDGILKPYQEFFEDYGFDVDIAHDGKEGLDKLRHTEFDVAIVDIVMPIMDGISMIRQAKQESIDTNFIVLTGNGGEREAVEALNLHVEAWVYKHEVKMADLLEKVREYAQGMPLLEVRKILSAIPKNEWQL